MERKVLGGGTVAGRRIQQEEKEKRIISSVKQNYNTYTMRVATQGVSGDPTFFRGIMNPLTINGLGVIECRW